MRLRIFSFATSILLFVFYCFCLPHYIQGGDTAELVNAADFKLVAHPPGYPLWVWLQHFWISIWPSGSVFFKASLMNAIMASKALFAVAMAPLGGLGILPVLWIGLGHAFMESAILPDVFAFHALFVAAIGYYYLFRDESDRLRVLLIPFYFAIGLTNHLTLIALAPVAAHVLWTSVRDQNLRKPFIIGSALGVVGFLGIYLSLLLLDTENPFSWGHLSGLEGVIHHFLRSDYGTLALTANEKNEFSFAPLIDFFSRSFVWYLPALAGLLFLSGRAPCKDKRIWIWSGSLGLSVGLFLAFHVPASSYGLETLIRFHVMPMVLTGFLMAFLLLNVAPRNSSYIAIVVLSLPIFLQGGREIPALLSLSNDSIIEDYSRQLIKEASEHQPALIFSESDTSYSGLRYIQMHEFSEAKIGVAMYFHFFDKAFFEKLKLRLPDLTLSDPEKIWSERKMKLVGDLFKPNYEKISIFTVRPFKGSEDMKVTFYPLGRLLAPGKGLDFASEQAGVPAQIHREIFRGPQHFTKTYLYSQYVHYYLAKGMTLLSDKKVSEAQESLERALAIAPYAYPALVSLCKIQNSNEGRCSPENMAAATQEGKDFF